MSDLISRKRLLELANKEGAYGYVDAKQILEAPTAYDPDKIVEQLEELANEHPYKVIGEPDTYSSYNEAWEVCADRAIEMVKKGGVE